MKPGFALSLSFEGISLLHRAAGGWRNVGHVPLDDPDLATALADLRSKAEALEPGGIRCKLILPNEQIRYMTIDTCEGGEEDRRAAVEAALMGATPYELTDLVWDHSQEGARTHIAAVARETLAEAEAFATEHAFNPVSFVAVPEQNGFLGEPYFGPTGFADSLPGVAIEPDGIAVIDIGPAQIPREAAAGAVSDPAPETAPGHKEPIPAPRAEASGAEDAGRPDMPGFSSRRGEGSAPPSLAGVTRGDTPPKSPGRKPQPAPGDAPEKAAAEPPEAAAEARARRSHGVTQPVLDIPEDTRPGASRAKASGRGGKPAGRKAQPGSARTERAERTEAAIPPAPPPSSEEARPGDDETVRMTVFGAREQARSRRGKPRHLGLILTVVLLLFLAGVAAWASLFVEGGVAGLFSQRANGTAQITEPAGDRPAAIQLEDEDEDSETLSVPEDQGARGPAAIPDRTPGPAPDLTSALTEDPTGDGNAAPASQSRPAEQPADAADPDGRSQVEIAAIPDGAIPDGTGPDGTGPHGAEPGPAGDPGRVPEMNPALLEALQLQPETVPPAPEMTAPEALAILPGSGIAEDQQADPRDGQSPQHTQRLPGDDNPAVAARYAATGISQTAPSAPVEPGLVGLGDLYVASIDSNALSQDAVALPGADGFETDRAPSIATLPTSPGQRFELDARGLVQPSPDGTGNPDGVLVYLGKPPVLPPATPERAEPEAESAEIRARLAQVRPRLRPANLAEQTERALLGGRSLEELARVRPKLRPETLKDTAEKDETPTRFAVAQSRRPKLRPRSVVAAAARAQGAPGAQNSEQPGSTQVAAVAPRTVNPGIPSSASVARQATIKNAINLQKVNLIGVYGTPANRRALVRLPSGRYKKVKVGDRFDGGSVVAIGDSELRYQKGGRNLTLKIPD